MIMIFDTIENITQNVLIELGLVNGTGTQIYTEPQITLGIRTAFNTIYTMRFWPHLTKTTSHNLDGVVGVITDASLVGVKSFEDIEWVRFEPYTLREQLPRLNGREYETAWREMIDRIPYGDDHWDTKFFKVYPETFTLPIKVRARRHPGTLLTGTIPFDEIALRHLAASSILASDGTNPGNQQRQQGLFESRYETLITAEQPDMDEANPVYSDYFTVAT
jgi:hypothetical protein